MPDIEPLSQADILAAQTPYERLRPGAEYVTTRHACDANGRPLLIDVERLRRHRAEFADTVPGGLDA